MGSPSSDPTAPPSPTDLGYPPTRDSPPARYPRPTQGRFTGAPSVTVPKPVVVPAGSRTRYPRPPTWAMATAPPHGLPAEPDEGAEPAKERRAVGEDASVGAEEPVPGTVGGALMEERRCRRWGNAMAGRVAEPWKLAASPKANTPPSAAGQPVAEPGRRGGDAHDGSGDRPTAQRTVEGGVAVGEHAAVGGGQPVAEPGRRGGDAHDGAVSGRRGASPWYPAEPRVTIWPVSSAITRPSTSSTRTAARSTTIALIGSALDAKDRPTARYRAAGAGSCRSGWDHRRRPGPVRAGRGRRPRRRTTRTFAAPRSGRWHPTVPGGAAVVLPRELEDRCAPVVGVAPPPPHGDQLARSGRSRAPPRAGRRCWPSKRPSRRPPTARWRPAVRNRRPLPRHDPSIPRTPPDDRVAGNVARPCFERRRRSVPARC